VHAGISNVVGQKLREMVPDEADGWVERYGSVLRTGVPIRFERELVATGRYLELAAFRIEPASRRQVAVLFQDISARKQAEGEKTALGKRLVAPIRAMSSWIGRNDVATFGYEAGGAGTGDGDRAAGGSGFVREELVPPAARQLGI